jgi:hypothetical protein
MEKLLGLTKEEIISQFYRKHHVNTLFGHETIVEIRKVMLFNKAGMLYKERWITGV